MMLECIHITCCLNVELLLELKGKRENICHSISAPFDSFDCMYVKNKKRVLIKCLMSVSPCQTYALSVKQDYNGWYETRFYSGQGVVASANAFHTLTLFIPRTNFDLRQIWPRKKTGLKVISFVKTPQDATQLCLKTKTLNWKQAMNPIKHLIQSIPICLSSKLFYELQASMNPVIPFPTICDCFSKTLVK